MTIQKFNNIDCDGADKEKIMKYTSRIEQNQNIKVENNSIAFIQFSDFWSLSNPNAVKEFKVIGLNDDNEIECKLSFTIENTKDSLIRIIEGFLKFTNEKHLNSKRIILGEKSLFGIITPSHKQSLLARHLRDESKKIGVEIVDYLIMTNNAYYSFKDNGYKLHEISRATRQ